MNSAESNTPRNFDIIQVMNIGKFVSGLKLTAFGGSRALKIGKTDLGILKVAFMVAALDGEVTDAEFKAFDALAKKCRGYSAKAAAKALDEAMRSAGYLMLLGRRVKDEDFVKAFMKEAQAALPLGFAYLSIEDVRRAVVTWIMMGLSDGDYSKREKLCVEALRQEFAKLRVMRLQSEEYRWLELAPSLDRAYCGGSSARGSVELVSQDFVSRVENLVAQYGDKAAAAMELEKLIGA